MELRQLAIDYVLRALTDELHADRGELRERAESLVTIAESAAVPIEELIRWIHTDAPQKEYSLREWRAYCAQRPAIQEVLFCTDYEAAAFDPQPRR